MSRRAGSGDALEALGLEGPTERGKVYSLGAEVLRLGSFVFPYTPEPAKGQPGRHVKGEENF